MQKKRSRHSAVSHIRLFIRFNIETAFSIVCHHVTVMCKARLRPRSRPILASWSICQLIWDETEVPKTGGKTRVGVYCALHFVGKRSARLHPRNLGHNRWRHCVLVYCGKISKVIMQMTEMINILAMICTSQCQWQSSCCRDSSRKKNKKCVHEAFKPETETLTH